MRKPGRSVALRLRDMLDAIAAGRAAVASAGEPGAMGPFKPTRLVIERAIEIVSEASRHVPEAMTLRHPDLPWRQIADIGNVIRHGYDVIDPAILIRIATADFDALEPALRAMLTELDETP